jgi:hypothetical protein
MIKKELLGTQIYSKELGVNIEVSESNIEVLKSINADVFENDKPKESTKQRGNSDTIGKDNDKQS